MQPVENFNWAPGEPSGDRGPCVQIHQGDDGIYQWKMANCDQEMPFICSFSEYRIPWSVYAPSHPIPHYTELQCLIHSCKSPRGGLADMCAKVVGGGLQEEGGFTIYFYIFERRVALAKFYPKYMGVAYKSEYGKCCTISCTV